MGLMGQKAEQRDDLSRELAEATLSRLYAEHGRDVLAYALRRVPDPEDAADVVAETFLVAWRRAAEVPAGAAARLWLYGVARRTLANQRRGERRRARLAERLRSELAAQVQGVQPGPKEAGLLRALAALEEEDREILLLIGWEGLEPRAAARVLAISPVAARSRLYRARRRLRKLLAAEQIPSTGAAGAELDRGEAR